MTSPPPDDPGPDPVPDGTGHGADHARVPVRIEEALGAAAMAAICLISFANVVVRYATDISFAFTEELSVFLLVFMTFVGASLAFAGNEHIRITYFLGRMPPALRWVCEVVTFAATTLMFSLVVYYSAQFTYDEWYWGEIYTIWLPLLSVAIILRVLGRAWATLRPARFRT